MKNSRQRAILEIISGQQVQTQEQLTAVLRDQGYRATQATVSRDIKELGLVKIPDREGTYYYSLPVDSPGGNAQVRLARLFNDSVVGMDASENLVVIRTLPGTAHAVASCIDHIQWPGIIGTVAGDDTILVVVKPKGAVRSITKRFRELLG